MQKSLSKEELLKIINEDTRKLKENIEQLRKQEGKPPLQLTAKQKELKRQYKKAKLEEIKKNPNPKANVNYDRFEEIVYRFKCPDCKSTHTKRTGLTTQREPKARFLCLNCQAEWRANKSVNRMFFTLSSDEIFNILNNDKSLTKEKRDFFVEKYLIKK